ncbi:unnamed protein product [Paramecium sonneborni]|uniref:Uncharacterized protein n=1 Tax=Paramecium sonneborni TaxID=65129 RepID=A0A8S1RU07_9CILI|nr:unnamed protein product [Paramecium sonneborni]
MSIKRCRHKFQKNRQYCKRIFQTCQRRCLILYQGQNNYKCSKNILEWPVKINFNNNHPNDKYIQFLKKLFIFRKRNIKLNYQPDLQMFWIGIIKIMKSNFYQNRRQVLQFKNCQIQLKILKKIIDWRMIFLKIII